MFDSYRLVLKYLSTIVARTDSLIAWFICLKLLASDKGKEKLQPFSIFFLPLTSQKSYYLSDALTESCVTKKKKKKTNKPNES